MKPWWQSRTVWWNVATIMLAFATELAPLLEISEGVNQQMWREILLVMNAVGNLILRIVTNKGLSI